MATKKEIVYKNYMCVLQTGKEVIKSAQSEGHAMSLVEKQYKPLIVIQTYEIKT